MGKSTPAPPPPPDYAAANKAAIDTDISTLPLRNAINSASQLGTSYTDPDTGKTYDFTGLGSQDVAHAQLMQQLQDAPESAKALLALQQQYGTQFADESRKELQATDPTGFALRDQLGARLGDGSNSIESLYNGSGSTAPTYESITGNGPELARLGGASDAQRVGSISLGDTGQSAAGRSMLESQIFDELAKAGSPDAGLTRSVEQAMRARGASNGNILGNASALQESLGVQDAQRGYDAQRRNDALQLLQSGQTTSDTTNRIAQQQQAADINSAGFNNTAAQQDFSNRGAVVDQNNNAANTAFQNAMAAIGQRNQSAQNTFGAQQGLLQQKAGARQQDLANLQSFLGLQPIVSQGAQLSGLQQGATPFAPGTGYQAVGTNAGAGQQGAEWAGQLYGAQNQFTAGTAASKNAATGAAIGAGGSAALGIGLAVF